MKSRNRNFNSSLLSTCVRPGVLLRYGISIGAFLLLGCNDNTSTPTSIQPQSQLLKPTESMVRLPEPYAFAGCSFVATIDNGEQLEAIIPRSALPSSLPRTDSVPATPGHSPGLKVISGEFRHQLSAASSSVRFSCLAPPRASSARATHAISSALAQISGPGFEKLLRSYPVPKQTADRASEFAVPAHSFRSTDLLLSNVSPSYARSSTLSIGVRSNPLPHHSNVLSAPQVARLGEWYEDSLQYPEPTIDTLKAVQVTGQYPNPVIVDLSWILTGIEERNVRFSDWMNSPDIAIIAQECRDANSGLDAAIQALASMEQDAIDADNGADAVADYNCEHDPNLVDPNMTVCIDFFIMGKTGLLFFRGDERSYDPNAPYTASRIQIYFNPAHPEYGQTILYNSTTVFLPIPWADTLKNWSYGAQSVFTPFAGLPQDVNVRDSSGSTVVKAILYDGACKTLGTGWFARSVCPKIDAKITMTPSGAGNWNVSYDRNAYPSVQVNTRPAGGNSWSEVSHSDEEHTRFAPLSLFHLSWDRWNAKYNEARNNFRLPGGCERM
jgi:hypothetical protein